MKIRTIAFDADDTLWHNERFFRLTQDKFAALLADHAAPESLSQTLLAAERRNLGRYGYGIKGFVLSMIETAIEVTDARVPAEVISQILDAGKEMLAHPIELLPHAEEAVQSLSDTHRILLITKGDLLDQERKLAQSGLGDLFHGVEIVSEKTAVTYGRIFADCPGGAESALMAGNSMKSDVVPVIEAGAHGVYVPHGQVWELEKAEAPRDNPRFFEIKNLGVLPALLEEIEAA
ncbi:HAD family hydrolase [Alphaproteobacteria bacterium KMM 3653]|uniref:HAD family hydrolase n=1 Tax=Harenicola maris TaxID=2841044 RepID=A0AAP2G8H7_9RHOB|nr:HAD family hydrolase [Harenicola maris]